MNFKESLKSAYRSVFANKMRSFLTMLGIVIGISSVILITSVGEGSQNAITGEFDKLGIGMVTISTKGDNTITSRDLLDFSDVDIIKKHPQVKNVSPTYQSSGRVKLRNPKKTKYSIVYGVNSEFSQIDQPDLLYGRFFIEADEKNKSKVVVIDNGLATKVFGHEDVIGQKISLSTWRGSTKLTVIGVVKNPNAALETFFGDNIPAFIYMPITTTLSMYGSSKFYNITASIKDLNAIDNTVIELTNLLHRKHRNNDVYFVQNAANNLEQINNILGIFTMFISFVAGISLVVGGVGVMNIMLVTVTERTREIGIRKSLGAKNRDIRIQFLIEAVIITFIGGVIGLTLGYVGGLFVGAQMNIAPKISTFMFILTFSISTGIGIIFGVYPANKAAKLDPIEALRYE